MFITNAEGRLIASIPENPAMILNDQISKTWLTNARNAQRFYVSPVHPRSADNRLTTDLVSPIRSADGATSGFIGVSVLVERIGRRLSAIDFADQEQCQIIDQNGVALFGSDFKPNPGPLTPAAPTLLSNIRARKNGHNEDQGNLYSYAPVESTGWTTVIIQPRAVAYKPVHDLLQRMTILAGWLIVGTAIIAWLAGKIYRRQNEATARIEREVIFNDKILANMPSGIALIDPETKRFLQANEAFGHMARRFGNLSPKRK